MPHLSVVARGLFSVPVSSANVERLFSAAGRFITRRRPNLSGRNACQILFGHANIVRGVRGDVKQSDDGLDGDASAFVGAPAGTPVGTPVGPLVESS